MSLGENARRLKLVSRFVDGEGFRLQDALGLLAVLIAVIALYLANLRRAEIVLFVVQLPTREPQLTAGTRMQEWGGRIHFAAYNNGARGGILGTAVKVDLRGPPGIVANFDQQVHLQDRPGGPADIRALEAGDMLVLVIEFAVKWSYEGTDRDLLLDFAGHLPQSGALTATISYDYITQPTIPLRKKQVVKTRKVSCMIPLDRLQERIAASTESN